MNWDWSYVWQVLPTLLAGLWVTVKASLLASAIALLAGMVLGMIRARRVPVLSLVVLGIVDFVRGTPLLVQLYVVFYVFPTFGLTLSPFQAGVLTLGINYTASLTEVYRAGIENVPRGQWDAATVLGLPSWITWLRVVIPQALRPIGPTLGNAVIAMFKESALLSAITVTDLMSNALTAASFTYRYLEPLTMVGFLYWVISYPCARGVKYWEGRVRTRYE